jgi:hypothetical protein
MAARCRYAGTDDFMRSINTETPLARAFLNQETHERWSLQHSKSLHDDFALPYTIEKESSLECDIDTRGYPDNGSKSKAEAELSHTGY